MLESIQDLLAFSRESPAFATGLSPRAGLALVQAARAWALVDGRGHVLPEDVQETLPSVVQHRLGAGNTAANEADLAQLLITNVPIP